MPASKTRAAVVALVAASALAAAAPAGAGAAAFRTGVYLDRPEGANSARAYKRIAATGSKLVRFNVLWRDVVPARRPKRWNPRNPLDPRYSWRALDAKLKRAVSADLTPLVTILSAPRWAQIGGVGDSLGSYRPRISDLADFSRAISRRYDGRRRGLPRVRYWQLWNEPNITTYLEPQFRGRALFSPAHYRRMVNVFADAVHAAAPGNLVVAGGLSPFTVTYSNVQSIGPLRFMRALFCMSSNTRPEPSCPAKTKFDIWAHHPYTSGGPFHSAHHPDDVSLRDLPRMRGLLTAARRAGRIVSTRPRIDFWVTEFSWDSKPPDPNGVPMTLLSRWTAEALYQMWRSGVSAVFWLMLRDDAYPGSPLQAGLYFRADTFARDRPKPTLTAYRFPFVAYLRREGVFVWGRTSRNRAGRVVIERRRGGSWDEVATVRTDAHGLFRTTLPLEATPKDALRARLLRPRLRSLAFSLTEPADRVVRPFG